MFESIPVTSYQEGIFIEELSTGSKTGKHFRVRLEAHGHGCTLKRFYCVIRQLKDAGLITARRIPRDPGEYRGSQAVYELTEDGWDAVHARRRYLEEEELGERRYRERCRQYALTPQRQSATGILT